MDVIDSGIEIDKVGNGGCGICRNSSANNRKMNGDPIGEDPAN